MTKKKKIQYIWDYYKIHIIVTVIVFMGIISFIHGQITKINYEFNLTVIGSSLEDDKIKKIEKALTPIVLENPSKKQSAQLEVIAVDSLTGGKGAESPQYMQKFMIELSANVIDLLILNKSDYDFFQNKGAFLKLDDLKGLDLSAIKTDKIQGTSDKGVYGINLQNNKLLADFGIDTKDKILCVPATSKQKDKDALAIKWIVGVN